MLQTISIKWSNYFNPFLNKPSTLELEGCHWHEIGDPLKRRATLQNLNMHSLSYVTKSSTIREYMHFYPVLIITWDFSPIYNTFRNNLLDYSCFETIIMSIIVFAIVDFFFYVFVSVKWCKMKQCHHCFSHKLYGKRQRGRVQADGGEWNAPPKRHHAEQRCATQAKSPISIISHELNRTRKV